jgi:NodT family efflux transporter outer membrane factor (OMF) lipoprotein
LIARLKIPLLFCSLAVLYGCAAVPDIKRPDAPVATQETATPQVPQGEVRKLVSAHDISSEWWVLFKSPQLSEHINHAFKANPNTETAQDTLRRAQEHPVVRQGFFYPRVGANSLSLSNKQGGDKSSIPGQPGNGQAYYNLHIAQLTVGYVPEVLSTNHKSGLMTQVEDEMRQEATYFTLASNEVAAAIQQASLRAQIEAQLNIVGLNRQALEIVHNQFKLGYVTEKDVTERELDAAQAQQALVPLQQQFEQTRDLLQTLAGNLPDADADTEDAFRLEELHLSKELPLSLSSRLVEQRPDVRAADAQLRSAAARYGVEVINVFPRFTITGATGGTSASPAWMLREGGSFFDLNANAAQFVFGEKVLRSKSRAAQQVLNMVAAQYRSVVMTAIQDVADILNVIQSDVHALDLAEQTAQSASTTGELTSKRYEAGAVDFPTLRVAQQSEHLAAINLAQAQANRLGDTVALFQALGGRWWKQEETETTKAKQP